VRRQNNQVLSKLTNTLLLWLGLDGLNADNKGLSLRTAQVVSIALHPFGIRQSNTSTRRLQPCSKGLVI